MRDFLLPLCHALPPSPLFALHNPWYEEQYDAFVGHPQSRYARLRDYECGCKRLLVPFILAPEPQDKVTDFLGDFTPRGEESCIEPFLSVVSDLWAHRVVASFIGNLLKRFCGLEYVWRVLLNPFVDAMLGAAYLRCDFVDSLEMFLLSCGISFPHQPSEEVNPRLFLPGRRDLTMGPRGRSFSKLLVSYR